MDSLLAITLQDSTSALGKGFLTGNMRGVYTNMVLTQNISLNHDFIEELLVGVVSMQFIT